MRIVSICPSNTELLGYLGLESDIVGVDNYSDWPEEVHHLPRLGPDLNIDMDAVERLKPDLVVASLSVPGMEKNIEALKARQLPYIVLNPNSLEEIGQDILELGKHTHREQEAHKVYHAYQRVLEVYRKLSQRVQYRPALYWEWWPKPVFTPGKTNWLTEISELAGARNVFDDQPQASVQTDWDEVIRRNPDYICLAWVGVEKRRIKPELVRTRPGWTEMPAVREKRILVLDEPLFCRPSPRLLTGLQKLAALLHPGHFPAVQEGRDVLKDHLARGK
ncbi:ABC-type transporter, periplasmic subunit [Caldalkalibacillus thermarum TA2.A1]|uniref:ABC-type transporter, periplasmic subunit n=1 Tax=Caldalkalibacillus thermarum (strain TA2.A1) TaxID=986075 RepID=F5L3V2_CALTT|nr:cobalamin-binding protein [Caldalkalibacillus thermarum]EGL83978.1 ABC-type transporter, periplasmic subunit [Caldalkalibacillus thermarum TA2.A1]QZT34646.1 cobalamin-binding protein [Caldalkalibacillus thermarum TA2.A1]